MRPTSSNAKRGPATGCPVAGRAGGWPGVSLQGGAPVWVHPCRADRDAGDIAELVDDDRIGDIRPDSQGHGYPRREESAKAAGMLAQATGPHIVQHRLVDCVDPAGKRPERAAPAHDRG